MAEAQEKEKISAQHDLNNMAKAAGTVKNVAQAAAKAGAGDVAGAVVDLLKDENVRKAIVAVIFLFCFVWVAMSMMVGTALTGTIEAIQKGFIQNWDESWEEQGVLSQGNALYLYTEGSENAFNFAMAQTVIDMIESLFATSDKASNSTLPGAQDTAVNKSDYQTALDALKDTEALAGDNGTLKKRIEMIKGRVRQRGDQLEIEANTQYAFDALGIAIGEVISSAVTDPILYNGVESASINFDTSVFELSDIQALKIMAAYSIQHDVILSESDMWDLMDYCGWYGYSDSTLTSADLGQDSIYNGNVQGSFTMSFGDAVDTGDDVSSLLSSTGYRLEAPTVPQWYGSFAPQWYYEELAQILKHNETYDLLSANPNATSLDGMIRYETNEAGKLIASNFDKLGSVQTYGLIDKLFTAGNATLTVSRTEYMGADAFLDEALASFTGSILNLWNSAYGDSTVTTELGNTVLLDTEGNHSYTIHNAQKGYAYHLVCPASREISEVIHCTEDGQDIVFPDLKPGTDYIAYYRPNGKGATLLERFKTLMEDTDEPQAYKLIFNLDVTYTSRSIDELLYDVMGLWPGDLRDTVTGDDGIVYAAGHEGNENLIRNWTDTYTAPDGTTHTISFERQQGYQAESYHDILLAMAKLLDFDTTGLINPDFGYGNDIVDMAEKELAYYQANALYGGMRYWDMAESIIGWNFGIDAGWCVCFILCCAYQCGYIGPDGCFGDLGTEWHFWCGGLWADLVDKELATGYIDRGSTYQPVPGDLVFFDYEFGVKDFAHVGIVKEVLDDGTLVTIEGNSGNRVKECTYPNYGIGTYCYTYEGQPRYITAYIHPNYPASFNEDPLYLTQTGATAAASGMRLIADGTDPIYLAGLPRFRVSQLEDVVTCLEESYPAIPAQDLRAALNADDMAAFMKVWNSICASEKGAAFRSIQMKIFAEQYAAPVIAQIRKDTGFDWSASPVREELLLAVLSSSDNHVAAATLLKALCGTAENNIADSDLLSLWRQDSLLATTLQQHRASLWPDEPDSLRTAWCNGIESVVSTLVNNQ